MQFRSARRAILCSFSLSWATLPTALWSQSCPPVEGDLSQRLMARSRTGARN